VRGITVSPVGRFALERLRRRGFDEAERYEPEFWDRVTRLAAESGALWKGCGFDTVIVDEGQDFGKHEWAIVMRCAGTGERGSGKSGRGKRGREERVSGKREDGKRRIWVFADEGQAFWEKRKIPPAIEKHAVKFDLGRPYRCTPGIQALADAYVGGRTGEGGGRARGLKEKAGREGVGALRVVVPRRELEKDGILKWVAELAEAKA
jgi:hypothetical protein